MRWCALLVLTLTTTIAGCSADDKDAPPPNADALEVTGTYALDQESGDIGFLSFVDDARYVLWRRAPECVVSSAPANIEACSEEGTYELHDKELVLVDGRTHVARTMPFERSEPTKLVSTVAPQDLANGASGSLLERGQRMVAETIQVGQQTLRLVDRGVELLTTCERREHGAGDVPGAADPATEMHNGVFNSGPYAPGGQYDTRLVGTGTLFRTANEGSHSYALISDRLPAGTTWDEANAALQRFNGPTGPAMRGQGDDPNSDRGWVVDPITGRIPVGCVTFERGDGWARNTTQANHPFIGTITRYVVDGGDGTYRILTVGQGQGPGGGDDGNFVGRGVTGVRHLGNVLGGPLIFHMLDEQLIRSMRR